MEAEKRCLYGDTERFGIVVLVFRGRWTVGRSTSQGDLVSIQSSVLNPILDGGGGGGGANLPPQLVF